MAGLTRDDVSTSDTARAEEELSRHFSGLELGRLDRSDFFARFRELVAREFAVVDYVLRAPATSHNGAASFVAVRAAGAGLRVDHGRARVDTSAWFAVPADGLRARWEEHTASAIVLAPAAVDRVAAAAAGEPGLRVRRTGTAPIDPDRLRAWEVAVHGFRSMLAQVPEAFESQLVERTAVDQLAAAFLHAFPSTWADVPVPTPARGSAVTRRAIEFMREHAGAPITVTEVAAATFITTRGLHAAFVRDLGISPSEALRGIRLDGARADLRAAAPDDTVTRVARRWGFAHLPRFASSYRAAFGESPSETLRG